MPKQQANGAALRWHWWRTAAVATLLAVHVCLAFLGVVNRSATSDETGHLTAGYAYWTLNDYRFQPENGNLPQRWGALPLLLAQPRLERSVSSGDWEYSRVWDVAQRFFYESGNNTDFLLLCARTTMLCWSVAAGLLVFWWARSLWGDGAGLGALALFCFSPTTLAHGPLVTSDMCAAVCLLASAAAWWRLCLRPDWRRMAVAGVATGLACLAKFSAAFLLPVFLLVAGFALWACPKISARPDRRSAYTGKLAAVSLGVAIIAAGLIWTFFGFRYPGANPAAGPFTCYYLPWERLFTDAGLWPRVVQIMREMALLPEAFLYGFSFVAYFAKERGAFLAGSYSSTGWWWFFPFAFLVKSTLGELLATALLAVKGGLLARGLRARGLAGFVRSPLLPLLGFAAVCVAFTLTSKLNIGQRHILPLYLVLFILSGVLFAPGASRLLRVLGWVAILASAAETIANHPHPLAFFNRAAGGPDNGWRLLVDSSLDWGQDVSALGAWVREHRQPGEPVYVSCFGTADPRYEGIEGELLSPYYVLTQSRHWFDLKPGLYCLSATMLQDVYGVRPGPWNEALERDYQILKLAAKHNLEEGTWSRDIPVIGFHPENRLWLLDRLRFARLCQYLKVRQPNAVINHTQFVFRLSADEIEAAVQGPFSALLAAMQRADDSSADEAAPP